MNTRPCTPHKNIGFVQTKNALLTPVFALFLYYAALPLESSGFMQQDPYQIQDGLVVIEAESLGPSGDWAVESSDAGFTGTGYLRWNGPDLFGTPGTGVLEIPFTVEQAGNYWVKMRSSHLGAPAGDQWNDAWVRMNAGGNWTKAGHPAAAMNNGFTFDMFMEPSGGDFIDPIYYLEPGTHTLFISGRSFNFRMDRIHIYLDGTPDPENTSYPESPRGSGGDDNPGGGGTFTLEVQGGSGSGVFPSGTRVFIRAHAPQDGFIFERWTGHTQHVEDPTAPQTSVLMPSTNVSLTATYTSATLREPDNPANTQPQIQYSYYEETRDFLPDFSTLTPVSSGTLPTISLAPKQQEDGFLFKYEGYVDVPGNGVYTFYTASDDGSQLFIGDRLIVDNDSIQSVQERSGDIQLKAGKHALTVTYFERSGDDALTVSWQGPGIPKQEIPAGALFHTASAPPVTPGQIPGDVSLNGAISALDASMILAHTIGQIPLQGDAINLAEVSGNGNVSAYDASLVLQRAVGLIACFPIEAGCSQLSETVSREAEHRYRLPSSR